ncbi:MAG TPA: putative holin [Nitratidesulfovibrio sp.]|nr:putative holin [Nitratidesulfovibrio sp.]
MSLPRAFLRVLTKVRHLRMVWCALVAVVLWAVLWHVAPREAVTVLYKITMVLAAAVAAYWVDRWLFPYARPEGYLCQEWRDRIGAGLWPDNIEDYPVVATSRTLFAIACVRRIVLMAAAMLAVGMGL